MSAVLLEPDKTGSYVLWLELAAPQRIGIGRLGWFDFPGGVYLYSGSALGKGGLAARLRRHLALQKKQHWHVDFLRPACTVRSILVYPHSQNGVSAQADSQRLECLWSQTLANLPGAGIPALGFGSRDCQAGCLAHLIHFPWLTVDLLRSELEKSTPGAVKIIDYNPLSA